MWELSFEKIENYDPYNSRANRYGMVKEWVARNEWGNAVAFGDTKEEVDQELYKGFYLTTEIGKIRDYFYNNFAR